MPHAVRERAHLLILGGYYDSEIVSNLEIEFDLDEFQREDLELLVPKWRNA